MATKPCDGPRQADPTKTGGHDEPRLVRSETLLGGQRQVVILHNDEHYVLRVTRQGKLILNK